MDDDLDLRLVRYFTVVAEQLSFGRAAAELHLAQPSLSRQIQRLEERLGVRLLDRTPWGNQLTEAGKAFLPEAHALLRAARRAVRTARAHTPAGRLTVGYVEDLIVTPAVQELRRRHPEAGITTRHMDCGGLKDADVLVARAPVPIEADEHVLYEEPRMLVVPAGHPLADRGTVRAEDFADEQPYPCTLTADGWGAYQLLGPDPHPVEGYADKLELVATGRAIAVVPVGDRRSTLRPDLVAVPIVDAPASRVVLASRPGDPNPLIREFLGIARTRLSASGRSDPGTTAPTA
ncbi:LysR family transcriptional regulator [Actinoplanes sp. RD1]|uniref:LysR family transcriptional regulator n=1 Tax=Actinoplanes sp. RD1 TaxID=3064538 RepID=UPI0027422468|nr:LysR family transcriptional regulator [Actinoplanes sp. RD1]